ncbi:MAG: hypothetical protein ACF8LL_08930, partial [Phycisphaerales bacterium]
MNLFTTTLAVLALSAPSIVCAPALAQERTTPTIEQITQEPDWIAMSPSSPRWLVDGSGILYRARRPGRVGRDFSDDYLIFTSTIDASERPIAHKITPENPGPYFTARGDWNSDASLRLLSHNGDLFLFDTRRGNTTQLTRTSDRESSAMFMANDAQIAFSRGGNWYIRPIAGGGLTEVQAADIRFSDAPKDPSEKREKDAEKRDDLQKQQRELFEIIRLDDKRDAMREDDRFAWGQAEDPTETPGPFYMGKGRRSQGTWLSPSGAHMLVATAPSQRSNDKRDIMPDYINEDGYVSTRQVRTKVGLQSETPVAFHLLDLINERVIDLSFDDLPTIKDDPLAWLKKSDEDEPGDSIEQAKKEAEAKENAKPRPVSSLGARWSDSGRYGAFMLRSHDNKDRWIVLVDTQGDEPSVFCAHHLHDEAWVGWNFNQFGFIPGSDTLWYVSEESNHAQLYT